MRWSDKSMDSKQWENTQSDPVTDLLAGLDAMRNIGPPPPPVVSQAMYDWLKAQEAKYNTRLT